MAKARRKPTPWEQADHPISLMALVVPDDRSTRGAANQRRLRLLLCACTRLVWADLPDDQCRKAVEAAERVADGDGSVATLARRWNSLERLGRDLFTRWHQPGGAGLKAAWEAADLCKFVCIEPVSACNVHTGLPDGLHLPATLAVIRDLFPDPAAPPARVPKRWRTATVIALAQGCYDARDFSRLPVLADALEDAGCDSEPLLAHLRGPGPHVRGCWAVDAVLGKS